MPSAIVTYRNKPATLHWDQKTSDVWIESYPKMEVIHSEKIPNMDMNLFAEFIDDPEKLISFKKEIV